MSQGLPLVSVVIPVYNGEAYLLRAIDSVLEQTYGHVEAVVVNDGSTDASGEVAESAAQRDARVKVVHTVNMGLSAARNNGMRQATGEMFGFLDADDWILPHKLATQVEALNRHPEADLVYGDYELYNEADQSFWPLRRGEPPRPFAEILAYRNWFAVTVPILRRRLADRVGGFDETLRAAEDWDYWYRCAQVAQFVYLPGIVAVYRQHAGQMHRDRARMREVHRRFVEKNLAHDPRKVRAATAFYHREEAKHAKAEGRYLRVLDHLLRMVWAARSLREAEFVWGLPR